MSFARRIHSQARQPVVVRAAGVEVERWEHEALLEHVAHVVTQPPAQATAAVAIGSINLDHFHHFGDGRIELTNDPDSTGVDWIMLADGAPVAGRAARVSGMDWPRLTGADLLPEILGLCQEQGAVVGFLGGTPATHDRLRVLLPQRYPGLPPAHFWAPERETVDSRQGSEDLAAQIAAAGVDVLNVALGKPRQEMWIQNYGEATQAKVLMAFGASADFLAGNSSRAPQWLQRTGLEWAYRLLCEPRRLARRYLVHGPPALLRWMKAHPVQ
ncbi:WecB/TagA/CpsF family glycosyltransferase [Gephyromycinifex aptenodytis]|uniref:WecB/TagA/CpsF family glycosyltransferase n=1 Tax=Gephyromycinifex aptenodytis TaxID=2716227 RepID=UPI001446843A|nr:WecB/TagA/CpsF family glycosyltransferase [Gephyromycinifex aptenodytis]